MQTFYENNLKNFNTIVFTGGGTGGHVYPNLALIPTFQERGYTCVYMGANGNTLEKRLAKMQNIPYYGVDAIKLVRSFSPSAIKNNLAIVRVLTRSINQAKRTLEKISPVCVFSKGGFASLPVVLAARKLGIPTFAHESDLTLGLANKIAKSRGAHMLKANPHSTFDGDFVGMPLRNQLFCTNKAQALKTLGINNPDNKKILLVLGGSLGASAINDAVKKCLDTLKAHYFILHVTGKNKGKRIDEKNYKTFEYADDISLFYEAADAVLSRAGATGVFEISALKKRAVFIPLPKGVSRGDQIFNGNLAKEYGGFVLEQNDLLCDNIPTAIEKALQNPPMRPIADDANGKIAEIVCATLRRGEKCKNKKPSQNG